MEKTDDFLIRLPVGYRFHPTDEELVVHYLTRKVFGIPLPASVIPELDVFQTDPWSLPGDLKEKRYFFTQKKVHESTQRKRRRTAAGSGYWRPLGKGKQIIASAIGIRRTLVFCELKPSNRETRSQWVMQEYSLSNLATVPNTTQKNQVKWEGTWAVYSIFQRKIRRRKHGIMPICSKTNRPHNSKVFCSSFTDFTEEVDGTDVPPHDSSSSCSSGITEVSFEGLDQEETTSCSSFISFSSHPFPRKT